MRSCFVLVLAWMIMLGATPVVAQLSQGGTPLGIPGGEIAHNSPRIVQVTVTDAERETWRIQDADNDGHQGRPRLFSRFLPVDVQPTTTGTWTQHPNGTRIWRVMLHTPGALGVTVFYDDFKLAPGARLFVYNPEGTEVYGAFTDANNAPSGRFVTQMIHGDAVVLELHEPADVQGQSRLHIDRLGYAYRDVKTYPVRQRRDFGDSGGCQVNAACPEGDNFQAQQDATVRIMLVLDIGQSWCSGTLMNNTNQDFAPYILTAMHCGLNLFGGNITGQANLDQWVFYFNYQSPTCATPISETGLADKAITGCSVLSHSNDGGGETGSDFLLLQTAQNVPQAWHQYYAGWDASPIPPASGIGLHHPVGDIMKVSTYTSPATANSWGGQTNNTHWSVTWVATTTDHGVTEGGSSGSALYNAQGHLVGTLTGGGSFCNDPNSPDDYGQLAYHWISNGTDANNQLRPWLDPAGLGVFTWSGAYDEAGTARPETAANLAAVAAFPNPATAGCLLNLTCEGGISQVVWADATGRVLLTENPTSPLAHYTLQVPEAASPGLYFIRVATYDGQIRTCRVVVQ